MPSLAPHILIVDDDRTFTRTLSRLLLDNGYETSTLSTGEGLPEYLATRAVDLLIVDLAASGRDGFSLIEQLRRDRLHQTLPVIGLAGKDFEEASVRALGVGASDVVAKPFRVPELLARIRAQLRAGRELNRARGEARAQAALVEILRDITANLSPTELYQLLVRRVATILRIPRCSILLAAPGDDRIRVAAAAENPMLKDLAVDIARYPEVRQALDTGDMVLVRDARTHPLYEGMTDIPTTSSLVLPFSLRGKLAGVFFLRTGEGDPPLGDSDVQFAAQVVASAVSAIENAHDVEEAGRREAAMRELAETDPLTGLYNRRALDEKLQQEIERAARYGTVLTCVMIDIDHFKATNDAHGHQTGDRVLVQFADLLRREQRAVDVVARYGGEEFVVLLPATGGSGARLFAERVLRRVSLVKFGDVDPPVRMTISLGLATYPDEQVTDGESLLRLADRNLLRAKRDGRNRYRD
jgi:two-component system, cell cycle response regulator